MARCGSTDCVLVGEGASGVGEGPGTSPSSGTGGSTTETSHVNGSGWGARWRLPRSITPVTSVLGFGEIDRNLACGDERRSRQDDHQQNEHHVYERNDIDLVEFTIHAGPDTESSIRSHAGAARYS